MSKFLELSRKRFSQLTLMTAIIFSSGCMAPDREVDALIKRIEKKVTPDKLMECCREVLQSIPSEKLENRTYNIPKNDLPQCWKDLGIDEIVEYVAVNGPRFDGPVVLVGTTEDRIYLAVYPKAGQGTYPKEDSEAGYCKKWREGVFVCYPYK